MGGVVGGGVGPCDFSVSPIPFGLDFGTLDFGTGLDNSVLKGYYKEGIYENLNR